MECSDGCGRPAAKGRPKCWACYKARERNGTPVRKTPHNGIRHPSSKAMVQEAIEAYNDADPMDEASQTRAWTRLRTAWRRYFQRVARNTVHKGTNTRG